MGRERKICNPGNLFPTWCELDRTQFAGAAQSSFKPVKEHVMKLKYKAFAAGAALITSFSANAGSVQLTVTVENLAPSNSVSFAPFRLGFGNGSFDSFDIGSTAGEAIVSVAEGGSGSAWFPAFEAADPGAVLGTVGGLLVPGDSASSTFTVDTDSNAFFSFAAMVVPSNDFFIGNDDPTAYELFDAAGNLLISEIIIGATEIWDAGSEVFDPAAAAFVGDGALRADQGSVVALNFAELFGFNGLETGADYIFDSQLTAGSDIYRISFAPSPVPLPAALPLFTAALACLGLVGRRRAQGRRHVLT
jgi:hypothetical protein